MAAIILSRRGLSGLFRRYLLDQNALLATVEIEQTDREELPGQTNTHDTVFRC